MTSPNKRHVHHHHHSTPTQCHLHKNFDKSNNAHSNADNSTIFSFQSVQAVNSVKVNKAIRARHHEIMRDKMERQVSLVIIMALMFFLGTTLFLTVKLQQLHNPYYSHHPYQRQQGHDRRDDMGGEHVDGKVEKEVDASSSLESTLASLALARKKFSRMHRYQKLEELERREPRGDENDEDDEDDDDHENGSAASKAEGTNNFADRIGYVIRSSGPQKETSPEKSNQQNLQNQQSPLSDQSTMTTNDELYQIQQNPPPPSERAQHQIQVAQNLRSHRVFHILETRFMQSQPHLIRLGLARLLLFKTICLPSVIGQSNWGQFVWIIRTDPNLDEEIRRGLVEILEESGALGDGEGEKGGEKGSTFVVGNNDNYISGSSGDATSTDVDGDANGAMKSRPFDIHDMLSSALSKPESIFAGKVEDMQKLLDNFSNDSSNENKGPDGSDAAGVPSSVKDQDEAEDVVLWTRIDADDGLNVEYMEYIQSQALRFFLPEDYLETYDDDAEYKKMKRRLKRTLQRSKRSSKTSGVHFSTGGDDDGGGDGAESDTNDPNEIDPKNPKKYAIPQWSYWCARRNIDWFLTDPIRDPSHENGTVYPVQHTNMCITPGISVGVRRSFDPLKVPRLDHDKIVSYLRPLSDDESDAANGEDSPTNEDPLLKAGALCGRNGILSPFNSDDEETDDGTCFHMINEMSIAAVRSRTPTSAGMLGITPNAMQIAIVTRKPQWVPKFWTVLEKFFNLENGKLVEVNWYFRDHLYEIAEENGRGQCTQGHSCKSTSKDALQQFVDLKLELVGGFEIVDG